MNDARFAIRQLAKAPGFTAVAVLTLALGMGACVAIFSVVNQVLVRPLPLPESHRVVIINETFLPRVPEFVVTSGKYLGWREQARSLASIGAWAGGGYILTGQGQPERLNALRLTASLLPTLGLNPVLGRAFSAAEEKVAGSENVTIISHGLWQRRFGGRADVLDQVVQLSGRPFTIIGVLPRESPLPERVEVLAPASFGEVGQGNFDGHFLRVFGRLAPGVTLAEARVELTLICDRLGAQHPQARGWGVKVEPMKESAVRPVRPALLALLGAVGFLLLIACANVANLLLARAMSRAREMAVRSALGASRARVIRQLLIESLVLSLLGAALGVLVASVGLDGLLALAPETLPRARDIGIDGRVLAFTFALAMLTGVGFGLAPAFQATRGRLSETLKEAGRGAGQSARHHRLRGALVIAEVGIALVLLAGAGLLMRSFWRLQQVSPGFNSGGAVAASVHLPRPKYLTSEQYVAFAQQAMDQMAAIPGVEAVAAATNLPFDDINNSWGTRGFAVEGRAQASDADLPVSNYYSVSPDYFRAMGIRVLRGRGFEARDGANAPRVAIVSESVAKKFFPDEDPLGKRLRLTLSPRQLWREIVGVVADVKPRSLEDAVTLQTYEPFAQVPDNDIIFVVRTATGAQGLPAGLRTALGRVDPDQPFNQIHSLERLVGESMARQRFAMTIFAVFSGVALLLAALGIYGVMAYTVAERRSEIGIRMALGAQTEDVLRLVLAQGGRLVAGGLALGVVGALLLTRFLETLLFGIGTRDPLTFVAMALVLALVAAVACLVPARRAARVQPMAALRAE